MKEMEYILCRRTSKIHPIDYCNQCPDYDKRLANLLSACSYASKVELELGRKNEDIIRI